MGMIARNRGIRINEIEIGIVTSCRNSDTKAHVVVQALVLGPT